MALVREIRALIAAGVPVTVAIGDVEVAEREGGGSIAAFSSRGLAFDGGVKPESRGPRRLGPDVRAGRGDDGEIRFGTVSGTSAAAAVDRRSRGDARPGAAGRRTPPVCTGCSSDRRSASDLDPTASGAGLVDLRAAAQLEVFAEPAVVSLRPATGDSAGVERVIRIRNVSTRRLRVSIGNAAIAPKGVEITVDPERVRLRPGASTEVVVRADTFDLSDEAGAADRRAGSVEPATRRRCTFRGRSRCRPPSTSSRRVTLEPTDERVSDATPAALWLSSPGA